MIFKQTHFTQANSAEAIEYANYISAEGSEPHPTSVLAMTLNYLMVKL